MPTPPPPETSPWHRQPDCLGDTVFDWDVRTDKVRLSGHLFGHASLVQGVENTRREAWTAHIHADDQSRVEDTLSAHLQGQVAQYTCDYRLITPEGRTIWVMSRGAVIERGPDGQPLRMIGTLTDISAYKQAERFMAIRSDILNMLMHERQLPALLEAIARGVEDLISPARCSILLLDRTRNVLRLGAAPSLPDDYNQAIDGLAIGPMAGTCGTAASRGQRVITPDIATDPAWVDHQALAQQAGLAACWSQPILSSGGQVLGTFALYHSHPHEPDAQQLRLIEQTAQLVTVALERHEAEERLHLAASVFNHAREGIMITDASGQIVDVNDTFTRITGYARDEVLGLNPRFLKSGRQDQRFYERLWRDLNAHGHWTGEVWNRRKNGEHYAELETISAVRDEHGQVQRYVALFSDITTLKEHEFQLRFNAQHDVLTGLPNRVLLSDRLHQAMVQARRRQQRLAVLYLDLDDFKRINDQHGHEVGDQLLVVLAQRLRQALREGDTLARIGGDEFVAVMQDLDDTEQVMPVVERILATVAEPLRLGRIEAQVSASLGLTHYPQSDEVDADQLLRQADQAMYQAKVAGKHRYHVFDLDADRHARGLHESLARIRHALQHGEFVLHHQPKVNMRTGDVIGTEALIRWQHPEQGLLGPASFLPVIEDHPLIVEVGRWVLHTALQQMADWHAQGVPMQVSVNVSARELQQVDFPALLQAQLAAQPTVRPQDLMLELLETSALSDLAGVSLTMNACRALGVQFALDDFGTGYSSLAYLKRLPVNQIKIDQSFVRNMLDAPDDLAILQGVVGLSRAFQLQVMAEGVETTAHGERLLALGCELAQGWGIARAMPASDIPRWVREWRAPVSWTTAHTP